MDRPCPSRFSDVFFPDVVYGFDSVQALNESTNWPNLEKLLLWKLLL
jgi:hypothetical protein